MKEFLASNLVDVGLPRDMTAMRFSAYVGEIAFMSDLDSIPPRRRRTTVSNCGLVHEGF